MNYFRRWNCLVCGKSQQTIDYPAAEVCGACIAAEQTLRHTSAYQSLVSLADFAHVRGFAQGWTAHEKRAIDQARDVVRLEKQVARYRTALDEIAKEDYRGPRPWATQRAFQALAEEIS